MAPASDGAKKPLGLWPRGQTPSAIGAPSAGLSLGGLRARRAHLRFTRRVRLSQEQSPVARPKSGGYDKQRVLNCGANGEFLLSLVGKSYCRWTTVHRHDRRTGAFGDQGPAERCLAAAGNSGDRDEIGG